MKIENLKFKIILIAIFLIAAFFRLYGLNWDQGQHLHPDERFLTMVSTDTSWPKDIGEYLDTAISPLNPHNRGFGFFVYGTFPVFFTKWVAESLGKGDYGNLTIVGRQLSAFFDLGTVLLVFLIAKSIKTPPRWQAERSEAMTPRRVEESKKSNKNRLFDNCIIGLFAAFLYAASVLPVQLSHFYAVETYLTFFITLSFFLCIKLYNSCSSRICTLFVGVSFGLALASKISAILFLPIIGICLLFIIFKGIHSNSLKLTFYQVCYSMFIKGLIIGFTFITATFLTFRLLQPYAFANSNILDITLNPKILENLKQLEGFMKPDSGFPPSVQWFGIKPFLFPFASLILWGLGLPLGIITVFAIGYQLSVISYQFIKKDFFSPITNYQLPIILSLIWIFFLFTYQSSQPAPTIRYFLPIYPFLAIIAGHLLHQCFSIIRRRFNLRICLFVYLFICLLILIYPLSFLSIYSRPHSRVAASEWIYKNIPYGATIATEHWDDGLPMTLDSNRISQLYKFSSLPLYDPDRPEKWPKIAKFLSGSDYVALTSNRLWGSITKAPKLFPQTSKYYKYLFDGSLGFEKIAEITSFPNIPLPIGNNCLYLMPPEEYFLKLKSDKNGLMRLDSCNLYEGITYHGVVIRDELAEETFTVYDHPKVLIFKKVRPVDYLQLLDDHNYKN